MNDEQGQHSKLSDQQIERLSALIERIATDDFAGANEHNAITLAHLRELTENDLENWEEFPGDYISEMKVTTDDPRLGDPKWRLAVVAAELYGLTLMYGLETVTLGRTPGSPIGKLTKDSPADALAELERIADLPRTESEEE